MYGIDVDASGRCAHWRGPNDIVALRMKCCGRWVACFDCHEAFADHPAQVWPVDCRDEEAVLCGFCGAHLRIAEYLDSGSHCPRCAAPFNPGCAHHHHLYFEMA
ncbi:MAG: CHY zinc finger protein [Gammaproteobacteria bacterium]|nr:CHY zinc finger protein [Gammaproteobacteria bacterium]